jgi:hypothetical protein
MRLCACLVILSAGCALASDLQTLDASDIQPLSLDGHQGDVQLLQDRLGDGVATGSAKPPTKVVLPKLPRKPPLDPRQAPQNMKMNAEGAGSAGPAVDKPFAPQPKKSPATPPSELKKEKLLQKIDMSQAMPLLIAGQGGIDTKCQVKGNGVAISGRAESTCVIEAPLVAKHPNFSIEIAFDLKFTKMVTTPGGRHGGIFYGASQNIATRAGNPTIDWIDRKADHGYRVYGNKDTNKINGMNPGADPNSRWRITISPDGKATFSAGAKTWLKDFTPKISGPFVGFWCSAGNAMEVSNVSIKKIVAKPTEVKTKDVSGLTLTARTKMYGKGTATLFYSESGGKGGRVFPKSIYLKGTNLEQRDFRTRAFRDKGGDIAATQDLVANRFVKLYPNQGFGTSFKSSGKLMFIGEGKGRLKDNSLYVTDNFSTQDGSIGGAVVQAKREFVMHAAAGFGTGKTALWYSRVGKRNFRSNTVYQRHGDFATQRGSLKSKDITAGQRLAIRAAPNYGKGTAYFWFCRVGKGKINSNTVYLKEGDLHAQEGSVTSARDIIVGRHLKLGAVAPYGKGEAKLWFVKKGSGKYRTNTAYMSSSFGVQAGSIEAFKHVSTNRFLEVGAFPGFGTGKAQLWYSRRVTNQDGDRKLRDKTLYLRRGNFATEAGSIVAKKDLAATKELRIRPSGVSAALSSASEARLWYAHRGAGRMEGKSLYLRRGNFGTETGNVVSPKDLVAAKYLEMFPFPGFGTRGDKVQLWYSAKRAAGKESATIYQKNGDFRVQAGSVYTNNVGGSRYLGMGAFPGHGKGVAQLFYVEVPTGKVAFQAHSTYLRGKVDFRVQNVYAANDLSTAHGVHINALKGFGNGAAELWFGKAGGAAGALNTKNLAPDTTYVRTGNFRTGKGEMRAKLDVEVVAGEVRVDTHSDLSSGPGKKMYGQLFYSHTGAQGAKDRSLYLRHGDLRTEKGSIAAEQDMIAHTTLGTLRGAKLQLKDRMKCANCKFGKILIEEKLLKLPHKKAALGAKPVASLLEESMVLLDETNASGAKVAKRHIDVEVALRKLKNRHTTLAAEHSAYSKMLLAAKTRLKTLEARLS